MADDIVTRLREEGFITHMARLPRESKILHAAADEIERLRAVVEAWLKYSQRAERDIETLRKERDEARRETCYELSGWKQSTHEQEARAEAKRRGWNCFKEATDGK